MNKLKYLFLLVLCLGLIGGSVSAQSDKVLVSAGGKTIRQTEVNKLIEFYEWAFEAEFSGEQRAKFAEYTAREFRANPKQSRATIDDIIKTYPKIIAAEADVQAETRKNFLAAFLPELRKDESENSQMLLSIYELKNGNTNNENDSYETVKNVSVGNLSAIVGKWVSGNTGSMTTTDSGAYLGGNASRHTYQFSANGAVEYTGIMNTMAGGCRMQIFRTTKGKATLNGDTLTINWTSGSFSRDDSCSPSKNYKKALPAETEVFKVKFETYYDDKQLCLTSSDKVCFSLSD